MENYPAVNIFCELWPFGTYDPDIRLLYTRSALYLYNRAYYESKNYNVDISTLYTCRFQSIRILQ